MRIEQVNEFVSSDGARFKTENACRKWEAEVEAVAPIMARLPSLSIAHGKFVLHDREVLMQMRRDLWTLVLAEYGESFPKWKEWKADEVHPMSIVGRVLDDNGDGPLYRAWNRLMKFDFTLGREYDQPYFVSHPDQASEATVEDVKQC